MLKDYYRLTKPGIVYGNAFTTLAAFLYASGWHASAALFCATLAGSMLVVASACVFNNYLDRGIDAKMERTKNRPLVTGAISGANAIAYGSALGIIGVALLSIYANPLTAAIALFGFLSYVFAYGWAKRASYWGTVVGSIPGAVPVVVGYTAVTGRIDAAAATLFFILVFWQMPHFYAIATYRLDEYAAAGIPVLPARKGIRAAKIHILLYIIAYLAAASALTALGYAGYAYLAAVLLIGLMWLWRAGKGFRAPDDAAWARGVFRFSLIVLVTFSAALSVASLLP
ncbi:MAG TPA: heme o synthase [Candidatus Paceibacterota bacterium]